MNRTIWIYWHQGEDKAPPLVRSCIASWRQRNPDWRVRVVDADTLHEYSNLVERIDLRRDDLTLQLASDLIRIDLLARHGGVWADASVYCARPLDEWLPDAMNSSGFFAFHHPKPDRLLASWFLAAERENPLVSEVRNRMLVYFSNYRFPRQKRRSGKLTYNLLKFVLGITPFTTRAWFSPWLTRFTGIYPYFAVHYTFAAAIHDDESLATIWQRVKPMSADLPHRLKHARKAGEASAELVRFAVSGEAPVHKLLWQADVADPYWSMILTALDQSPQKLEA